MINQPLLNHGARMPAYQAPPAASRPLCLTKRERTVVAQLALGKTNKEIACALGLTEGTIKVYLSHLKAKDPEAFSRYNVVKHLVRDHERVMAIRLNKWIQQWSDGLPQDALSEIRGIMADQVAGVLTGGVQPDEVIQQNAATEIAVLKHRALIAEAACSPEVSGEELYRKALVMMGRENPLPEKHL